MPREARPGGGLVLPAARRVTHGQEPERQDEDMSFDVSADAYTAFVGRFSAPLAELFAPWQPPAGRRPRRGPDHIVARRTAATMPGDAARQPDDH